ncbi:YlbF family regulator [Bacilliculturomica massiliensis]|uniref:YlbF family regulator n=1 Tax=Bacilliculturomica massiliensis TaxID=1917867 RepID=UPI0010320F6A|nr:YlbF family regulator [Bacilliculturomica massiliensis]
MSVNVHDKAHELARALKESAEYKHYMEIKAEVSQNPELSQMINDFQEKNMAMQTQQMLTGQPPEDMLSQVQSLYQILMADPAAARYLQAEIAFTQIVADVYGILGEVIRVDK